MILRTFREHLLVCSSRDQHRLTVTFLRNGTCSRDVLLFLEETQTNFPKNILNMALSQCLCRDWGRNVIFVQMFSLIFKIRTTLSWKPSKTFFSSVPPAVLGLTEPTETTCTKNMLSNSGSRNSVFLTSMETTWKKHAKITEYCTSEYYNQPQNVVHILKKHDFHQC